MGINSRIISLLLMGIMLYYSYQFQGHIVIWFIFILIATFSLGGASANVSYTDILGKSITQSARKSFSFHKTGCYRCNTSLVCSPGQEGAHH